MRKLYSIALLLIALVISMPITFAATQNLIYDANGNLVTGDGKFREYDGFNHLVKIRDGNNATGIVLEDYRWHPVEERTVIKHVYLSNGSLLETVYYPSKEFVRVKNTSGTFDFKYIYQNGQLIAQELVGGEKHFMLNDHKGSVQVVTNSSGTKVEETFYSPFGEIIGGGSATRFDYEGKEFDSVVGDYDFNARKMEPQWAIFITPDPNIQNPFESKDLNHYSFVRNNPYKYTDPDGKDAVIANYDIGGGSSGYDYGHSSLVVGSDKEGEGWTAYWFGTAEPEVYEKGITSLSKETTGKVIIGSGSTWQEALTSLEGELKGAGHHDRESIAYFKTDTAKNNVMKSEIAKAYENQKESKYNPLWNNCGQSVANILQSGGINTNKAVLPNVYQSKAKVAAKVNNAKFETKTRVVKLIKSITSRFKRSKK